MDCERCLELEVLHSARTDDYIGLVERQSRLFRNSETQAGRELDPAITAARAAMYEAQRNGMSIKRATFASNLALKTPAPACYRKLAAAVGKPLPERRDYPRLSHPRWKL